MRQTISPIRVIEQVDEAGKPRTATIRTIVAIDSETDQAWDDSNRLYTLSDIETWPRPQDDVYMQEIVVPEVSTIAANGVAVKETLIPVKKADMVQQPKTTTAVQHVQESMHVEQEQVQVTQHNVTTKDNSDMLHQLIKRVQIKADVDVYNMQITSRVDVAAVCSAAQAFGYTPMEAIIAMLDCGHITDIKCIDAE